MSKKGEVLHSILRNTILGKNGKAIIEGMLRHKSNIGLTPRQVLENTGDFSEVEIAEFLKKNGFENAQQA